MNVEGRGRKEKQKGPWLGNWNKSCWQIQGSRGQGLCGAVIPDAFIFPMADMLACSYISDE